MEREMTKEELTGSLLWQIVEPMEPGQSVEMLSQIGARDAASQTVTRTVDGLKLEASE